MKSEKFWWCFVGFVAVMWLTFGASIQFGNPEPWALWPVAALVFVVELVWFMVLEELQQRQEKRDQRLSEKQRYYDEARERAILTYHACQVAQCKELGYDLPSRDESAAELWRGYLLRKRS